MVKAEPVAVLLPIAMLERNEAARVVEVVGEDGCVQRLREMGLREGVRLCMLSPGTPFILAVEGRRISLRIDCDADVLVAPLGADAGLQEVTDAEILVQRC